MVVPAMFWFADESGRIVIFVTLYRAVVAGRPVGPWRSDRRQARRDLIAINLGEYDADGIFYCLVPGDVETRRAGAATG